MGLDSTAVLLRWLTDPSSRDFPLSALTVIVAQVGDEYPDTYTATEQVVWPLLAAHRVRTVQVARPALTTRGGKRYVVLDDTAAPTRVMRSGPVRLSDELSRTGTVAQVSNRRCSLKWKGEVLDAWIADHMPPGFVHVLGYAAGETRRIVRDAAIGRHGRRPLYPLREWGWTRDTSGRFLRDVTGVVWKRSCCAHCPFQSSRISRAEWAARWAAYPASGALGLRLEHTALALNPRMRMFGAHTARDLATAYGLSDAMSVASRQLAAARWALYEVRRTYTGPSAAMRSVRALANGTRAGMHAALAGMTGTAPVVDEYGIHRVWLRPPTDGVPRVEHLLVAAPVGVAAKQRPAFEHVWQDLSADDEAPLCAGAG